MSTPFGNYRKTSDWRVSVFGEVPCKNCRWSVLRPRTNRYECRAGISQGRPQAVGRNNTCDYAQKKEQAT